MERADKYINDIELLFQEWKNKAPSDDINHSQNVFIEMVLYAGAVVFPKVRHLYLLKEAYHVTSDWDLIKEHLLTEAKMGKHITWKRVSQWTQGLLHTSATDLCPFRDEVAMHYFGNEQLRQIAVVNVKKSDGAKDSEKDNILQYAEYDRTELRREIELIDPTIIVCGYTITSLNVIMGYNIKDRQNSNLYYFTRLNGHDVIVLDYYHRQIVIQI
ncbi:MAG: hypothetical protein ACLVAH_12265 [Anaeromassilibacillus sp.]